MFKLKNRLKSVIATAVLSRFLPAMSGVSKTGAYPTHKGAKDILNDSTKKGRDEYARQIHQLTDPIWESIKDKAVRWPS